MSIAIPLSRMIDTGSTFRDPITNSTLGIAYAHNSSETQLALLTRPWGDTIPRAMRAATVNGFINRLLTDGSSVTVMAFSLKYSMLVVNPFTTQDVQQDASIDVNGNVIGGRGTVASIMSSAFALADVYGRKMEVP